MKNNTIKKTGLKTIFALSLALAGFNAQAQSQTADITKQGSTQLGQVGNGTAGSQGSVRVIDNKGTIKFLQVKNGITQITNSAPDGGITTTWQLGGTLTDDTYIDATNKVFALDGIKLVPNTLLPSTNAADGSKHGTAAVPATTSGYTFLVRDEATGETLKMAPSQLVISGGDTPPVNNPGDPITITDPTLPTKITKVWVYRNGAKLLGDVDYTLAAGTLTINGSNLNEPNDYTLLPNDKIEVQWVN
ncbi:hypothetical protein HYN56_20760 [Flavobacterium crocinum]|uniref:Heme-binding protein Shr-like Hb-interacting domain-containing protein n=1 Tax=Flavobacterium crocinum TaxID=2183896 RepID=A0A2S1YR67_9FLAO|nr:hypothetical protein [Flavobacterium crocinum]AWK06523.1 hypothetical protein HYN56_20760 [Flavobacterium crocinum]